uniref:Uncharacterized protein n=1 Tax=Ascaris lumbricoides TaxID=6252 RepID=A0A0M3IVW8_ASCLU
MNRLRKGSGLAKLFRPIDLPARRGLIRKSRRSQKKSSQPKRFIHFRREKNGKRLNHSWVRICFTVSQRSTTSQRKSQRFGLLFQRIFIS